MVKLTGEIDMATAPSVVDTLAIALKSGYERIVVDMGGLTFIDSVGIRAILTAEGAARAASERLFFRRGAPDVDQALKLSGVDLAYLD